MVNYYNLSISVVLNYVLFYILDPDNMCHFLKSANTEEMGRNLLKNGYWLIDDDISCLDQLWSFGAIDLILCKNSVKDSCKVALIPSPYDSFHAYNKKRRKPFVRDSHGMHTEDTPSGRHRCRLMQMTEVDGRHRKHEVENSN